MFWYWKKQLLYRLWQRINIEMQAEISHLISGLLLTIRKRHFQLYSMRYESVSYLDLFWKEVIFLFRKGTINRVFRSVLIPKSVCLCCFRLHRSCHRKELVCGIHILPLWKRAQSPSICVCVFFLSLSLWKVRLWRQGRQTIPAEVAEVAYVRLSEEGSHNRIPSGK